MGEPFICIKEEGSPRTRKTPKGRKNSVRREKFTIKNSLKTKELLTYCRSGTLWSSVGWKLH